MRVWKKTWVCWTNVLFRISNTNHHTDISRGFQRAPIPTKMTSAILKIFHARKPNHQATLKVETCQLDPGSAYYTTHATAACGEGEIQVDHFRMWLGDTVKRVKLVEIVAGRAALSRWPSLKERFEKRVGKELLDVWDSMDVFFIQIVSPARCENWQEISIE